MNTKANWPEGMTYKISPNGIVCSFYDSDNLLKGEVICNLYDNNKSHLKNRALQIQHLPQMVNLLKRVMKDSVNEDMLNDTRALLKEIGERE